jgi:hypothetical protein
VRGCGVYQICNQIQRETERETPKDDQSEGGDQVGGALGEDEDEMEERQGVVRRRKADGNWGQSMNRGLIR